MRRNWIVRGVMVALVVALALVVFSWAVMSLWNWLIPGIIGWKPIDFWQALGLLVLSRILFGGLRGRFGYGMHWRARMAERWQRMTPEEREKFRAGMRGRCGHRTEDPVASGEH
jgi:hypothetical protein